MTDRMVTAPLSVAVATHVLAAILGWVMAHALTIRVGERLSKIHPKENKMKSHTPVSKGVLFGSVALIVSLFLVGFGIQQAMFQQAQDEHDDCLETWGGDLTTSIQKFRKANQRLERVETAKADALDDMLLAAIAARDSGDPDAEPPNIGNLIVRYTTAVSDLRAVQEDVRKVRRDYPYPELNCGG